MQAKIFFYLLVLCVIWSQEIIRTFADEIGLSEKSDFLIRQKRVVSIVPNEDKATGIANAPYVVAIKHNRRISCVGTILSHHVVITIAKCVQFEASQYDILYGKSRVDRSANLKVINIKKHYASHPSRPRDGVALLTVDLPFIFGPHTNAIELHSGPLLQGTVGLISGWGYDTGSEHGTKIPRSLRTILVNIMAHKDCVNIYRRYNIEISDEDLCTFDPQRHCGHSDGGAPLVVDGYLAGIHLWTGPYRFQSDPQCPDVFLILQHSQYNQWIRTNVRDIEAQFSNHFGNHRN